MCEDRPTLTIPLQLTVNGQPRSLDVEPHHSLLKVIREQLDLTGTKECCSSGECGACTVLFDGRAIVSCIMLAAEAHGSKIVTIEGLDKDGRLDSLQAAFIESGAVQCGFCIPGMIMAAKALLIHQEHPSVADIQEGLAGNLCRCAGYSRIIQAVAEVASGEACR